MPFVRRRPLMRMAAVGGVAYMGAKAGTNRAMQQGQAQQQAPAQAQQQPQPAPAPQPTAAPAPAPAPAAGAAQSAGDRVAQLQQLAQLHDAGALSDEEFAQAKAKVLA